MSVNNHTWTTHVWFAHIPIQGTHICMQTLECIECVHCYGPTKTKAAHDQPESNVSMCQAVSNVPSIVSN